MYFCEGITASVCAKIDSVNRNIVSSYYNRSREFIFGESLKEAGKEFGEFECDGSYFGARWVRVSQMWSEDLCVGVWKNCSHEGLMPIIQRLTLFGSKIYTDIWKACDGLRLNGYKYHQVSPETSSRSRHENEFVRSKNHVNGIENFWLFANGRRAKFNACNSDKFVLYLKGGMYLQCSFKRWRYDHKLEDLLALVKKLFRFAKFS